MSERPEKSRTECNTTPLQASSVVAALLPADDGRYITRATIEADGRTLKVSATVRKRGGSLAMTDSRNRYAIVADKWHAMLEVKGVAVILTVGQLDEQPVRFYAVTLAMNPIGVMPCR